MISFQNVSMVYPNGTAALNNVTLNIKDGEFVFIIGKSGAGKTTLTKAAALRGARHRRNANSQ